MGFLAKLLGKSDPPLGAQSMTDQRAVEIVRAYGWTLEHEAPAPGCARDESRLPFPKQVIKDALVHCMRRPADPGAKEFLKVGYLSLSSWQPGIGESDVGLDLTDIDFTGDPEKVAALVVEQCDDAEKWSGVMEDDTQRLRQELVSLGLW